MTVTEGGGEGDGDGLGDDAGIGGGLACAPDCGIELSELLL